MLRGQHRRVRIRGRIDWGNGPLFNGSPDLGDSAARAASRAGDHQRQPPVQDCPQPTYDGRLDDHPRPWWSREVLPAAGTFSTNPPRGAHCVFRDTGHKSGRSTHSMWPVGLLSRHTIPHLCISRRYGSRDRWAANGRDLDVSRYPSRCNHRPGEYSHRRRTLSNPEELGISPSEPILVRQVDWPPRQFDALLVNPLKANYKHRPVRLSQDRRRSHLDRVVRTDCEEEPVERGVVKLAQSDAVAHDRVRVRGHDRA